MVKCAFAQRFRCGRTVLCEDTLFDRTGIDADADRNFLFAAHGRDGFYAVIAADVAGVDADFIHARRCGFKRKLIIEMNIRHERNGNFLFDGGDQPHGVHIGDGGAENLAAGFFQCDRLPHAAFYIGGGHVQHGLHGDGRAAADFHIARHDLF